MSPPARERRDRDRESRFGGFTDIDGTVAFYTRVQAPLSRHAVIARDVARATGAPRSAVYRRVPERMKD
jgi:hypothetical protein